MNISAVAARNPSPEVHRIRLLIVDDHAILRGGLRKLFEIEDDFLVVGEAGSGEDALAMLSSLQPEIVMLDLNLPGLNGLQITSMIKSTYHNTIQVIMLSAHSDREQVLRALRAGAAAYCPKEIEVGLLLNTIRLVAQGNYVVDGKPYNARAIQDWIAMQLEAMNGSNSTDTGEHYTPLSPREMEILRYVTRGLSNKEIAAELSISHQTVKNHMTSILDKLNVEDRTQAAVYALERGWVRGLGRPIRPDND